MKIDIIVVYIQRYERGHEVDFVPPITGIHLAAITPPEHRVRVIHQQVEPVRFDTDADLIALSFFSGFAPEAYRLAAEFRRRGKIVVAGGPHATFSPDEVLRHCDSVVLGEAESVWPRLIDDAEAGALAPALRGRAVADARPPHAALRPAAEALLRDPCRAGDARLSLHLLVLHRADPQPRLSDAAGRRRLTGRPLRRLRLLVAAEGGLVLGRQPHDTARVRARAARADGAARAVVADPGEHGHREGRPAARPHARVRAVSGSSSESSRSERHSLADARKRQNRVAEYRERIEALHRRGICVMSGFIAGFDGDTPDAIRAMARQLYEIGVDVPFLSILTPYRGTALHRKFEDEGRILAGRGWEFYNGYNVAFAPARMTPEELLAAHRALWFEAFSVKYSLKRVFRAMFRLRFGAFLMCAMMNLFYCLKALRGNAPACFDERRQYEEFRDLPVERT